MPDKKNLMRSINAVGEFSLWVDLAHVYSVTVSHAKDHGFNSHCPHSIVGTGGTVL